MSVLDLIKQEKVNVLVAEPNPGFESVSFRDDLRDELLKLAELGERMEWVPVTPETMPEIQKNRYCEPTIVLATDGKIVARAAYVPKFTINCEDQDYDGDQDYNEIEDKYYWPEGWYEWNDCEETHWMINAKITHWMPLPEPPKEDK
jgi:hypothetical protein